MKVYLDMDGVLCNFFKAVSRIAGEDISSHGQWRRIEKPYWEFIAEQAERFWSELEWMPEGEELVEGLLDYVSPNILATSPSDPANVRHATIGKRMWLKKHLNDEIAAFANVIPARDKYLYSTGEGVLIDADVRNIEQWRKAGGIAVHHRGSAQDTLDAMSTIATLYEGNHYG